MKRFKLVLSEKALHDLEEARSWYNLQQKHLGKRLVTDVKKPNCIYKTKSLFRFS